jgi:hypothetical protein
MKIELKKHDKYVTYYMVFECPKGSGMFTPAYRDPHDPKDTGVRTTAYFHKRELAEKFGRDVMSRSRGWRNGKPDAVPMDWIIKAIRLPARIKERAAAAKAYAKHRKQNPL